MRKTNLENPVKGRTAVVHSTDEGMEATIYLFDDGEQARQLCLDIQARPDFDPFKEDRDEVNVYGSVTIREGVEPKPEMQPEPRPTLDTEIQQAIAHLVTLIEDSQNLTRVFHLIHQSELRVYLGAILDEDFVKEGIREITEADFR